MDQNEKIVELLQEIRDNQKMQIVAASKMRVLYIKVVGIAFAIFVLHYLVFYISF